MRWMLLLLVFLLPNAVSAGELALHPVTVATPLVANGAPVEAVAEASYTCSGPDLSLGGATLVLEVPALPAGISLTGPMTYPIPPEACRGPLSVSWKQPIKFELAASLDASGEKQLGIQFRGHVVEGSTATPSSQPHAEAGMLFSVQYHGAIAVEAPRTTLLVSPGEALQFDVTVTNHGNAASAIGFQLSNEPPAGWMTRLPAPLILGPSQQAGGSDYEKTATFDVNVPARPSEGAHEFVLRVLASSTLTPDEKAEPVELRFVALVQGCATADCLEAPKNALLAPAGPMALLAVLGCALVGRRRTRTQ